MRTPYAIRLPSRLKTIAPSKISSYELARKENIKRLKELYNKLSLDKKVQKFEDIFEFKAINLSGISLDSKNLMQIKEGKYVQIIAISYDASQKVKNKNISLGYYGRSEKIDENLKKDIVSFIISWRFEKSFMTLEHYHGMLNTLKKDA